MKPEKALLTQQELLVDQLEKLDFPNDAIHFLVSVWDLSQFFDDVVDNPAEIGRHQANDALWDCFVKLPTNTFYLKHQYTLTGCIIPFLMKWQASDSAERAGRANEQSYMWRAGFYDVVLTCFTILKGPRDAAIYAETIMNLYNETYEEYKKEFKIGEK